jgi:uncharacterized protein (TIGR02145 family)
MTQNLRATIYNDGTDIHTPIDLNNNGTTNDEWMALTSDAYCWFNNINNDWNRNTFGALYNCYAVNTGKLCPSGWHVPSDDEWTALRSYLDPAGDYLTNTAGGQMKSTELWWAPNTGATNASGFTGLPGGLRSNDSNGRFVNRGRLAYFWSSTENLSVGYNFFRRLHYDSPILSTSPANLPNKSGFSVRCLKNN